MADADPGALPETQFGPATGPPCRHLRSKGMYVYTDADPDSPHEESDTTAYWCLKTMTSFGPDDEAVARLDCRAPGRSCYEAS